MAVLPTLGLRGFRDGWSRNPVGSNLAFVLDNEASAIWFGNGNSFEILSNTSISR